MRSWFLFFYHTHTITVLKYFKNRCLAPYDVVLRMAILELPRGLSRFRCVINDYSNHFNDLYFEKISSKISNSNWGVIFKQTDESIPKFEVDIYTDNNFDYSLIRDCIQRNPPDKIEIVVNEPYWGFAKYLE